MQVLANKRSAPEEEIGEVKRFRSLNKLAKSPDSPIPSEMLNMLHRNFPPVQVAPRSLGPFLANRPNQGSPSRTRKPWTRTRRVVLKMKDLVCTVHGPIY